MNTTQTPAASKELAASDQKYFSAESIEIKVPSFSSGVKPQSYKDKLLTQGTVVCWGEIILILLVSWPGSTTLWSSLCLFNFSLAQAGCCL